MLTFKLQDISSLDLDKFTSCNFKVFLFRVFKAFLLIQFSTVAGPIDSSIISRMVTIVYLYLLFIVVTRKIYGKQNTDPPLMSKKLHLVLRGIQFLL